VDRVRLLMSEACAVLFYVFTRDYDVSGDDFREVIEEHVAKCAGRVARLSDPERAAWSRELAERFVDLVSPIAQPSTSPSAESEVRR
jgi:hypothetical protein